MVETLRAAVTTRMTVVAVRPSPAHPVPIRIDQLVSALQGSLLGTGVYDHVPQVKDGPHHLHGHLPRGQLSALPVVRGVAARRTARRARPRSRERHLHKPRLTQCSTPTDADRTGRSPFMTRTAGAESLRSAQ